MRSIRPDMKLFAYAHLAPALADISRLYHDLAHKLVKELPDGVELDIALRKLIESKDAAVRARVLGSPVAVAPPELPDTPPGSPIGD